MSVNQQSIDEFLRRLASGDPTPGGGSAAAVMGAMAAGLASMVCNVSFGRKGCEGAEPELRELLAGAERARTRLTALADEDIEAFGELMAAYKMPKSTEQEKNLRSAAIQHALARATLAPLECARACAEVVGMTRRLAEIGYKGVISDAGVSVLGAYAALRSAALNVYINVPLLNDKTLAEGCRTEMEALAAAAERDSEAIYCAVRARL
jgi:formiminotetrahydrofolate cyclodeaminase